MARDLLADKVVTLVREIEITAEAVGRKGGMLATPTPPPPHQYGQKIWGGGQNC